MIMMEELIPKKRGKGGRKMIDKYLQNDGEHIVFIGNYMEAYIPEYYLVQPFKYSGFSMFDCLMIRVRLKN
jgi:hypothetical protein